MKSRQRVIQCPMMSIKKYLSEKYFHEAFEIGIILKGLNGILEILGGILLLLIKPAQIISLVQTLTQHELAQEPRDIIANYLLQASHQLSISSELFGAVYLLSHGIIKMIIVIGLLKNKLWAYPFGIVVFSAFGLYQIYRYTYSHSLSLMILTILDVIVIFLTYHEYRYVKKHRAIHVH